MSRGNHILLVEDDDELRELLAARLESEGYRVTTAGDGLRAQAIALGEQPDLIVLDIGLPGQSGLDVCRAIRPTYEGPILFVSARDSELDQILGLELGGDDYLVKPVSSRLLLARVRALLRRSERQHHATEARADVGPFRVDITRREVRAGSTSVPLTTAEFDLLAYLGQHAGRDIHRDELYSALLGTTYDGLDRTIDVQVARVRQKLEAAVPGGADAIRTVRGVGYLAVPGQS